MSSARTRKGLLAIPTIDISAFRDPDGDHASRAAIAKAVDTAARTVGFMQITGHAIPERAVRALTDASDAFFALESAVKATYRRPPGINRGYSPPKSEFLTSSLGLPSAADLFEAFNIGTDAAAYPELDLPADVYAPNAYPREVSHFESAVTAWFGYAGSVARTMTRIFGVALGLGEDYFAAYTDHSVDVLRMINYQLPSADVKLEPDQAGMGAHTDYGIVTVLWADRAPGLQVLDVDGVWHSVQPGNGALLVNLGDALARWTNDRWISTMHRVAAPRVNGRLVRRRSAAFFHDGNIDAVIACLPSCVGPSDPARYTPVTVGEHLTSKLSGSRAGQPNPNARREAGRLTWVSSQRNGEATDTSSAVDPRPTARRDFP